MSLATVPGMVVGKGWWEAPTCELELTVVGERFHEAPDDI